MAPKFGTSGLRGLVVELTDDVIAAHVTGFVQSCDTGGKVLIGADLRPSSEDMAQIAAQAVRVAGAEPVLCGELPTPALALAAHEAGAGAIMITGSHIPADRNGLKFYTLAGEITKDDEARISHAAGQGAPDLSEIQAVAADPTVNATALAQYADRYVAALGPRALAGMSIGLYQHSTVGRDLFAVILEGLGARVTPLGRSDVFIPVDTEAVSDETRAKLSEWAATQGFDAIVSADGDADRPLVTDATGKVVPGDILGYLTAQLIGADVVVTPITSNTMLEVSGAFRTVHRTRIGSPYVIAGIEAELAADPNARVVGFEPNGGLMLGSHVTLDTGPMAPLMTRDAMLPILAPLILAHLQRIGIAALLNGLPRRQTAADRLQDVRMDAAQSLLRDLASDPARRETLFGQPDVVCDLTDGVRLSYADGTIAHLRMSGNAAELRCYAEAETEEAASDVVRATLAKLSVHVL